MKKLMLLLTAAVLLSYSVFAGTNISVSSTTDSVTCFSSSDGAIYLNVSGGSSFQTSTKGLLISEFLADPSGSDSPFEFVELIATKTIDFSVTPYTIIFVNNGIATSGGWAAGADKTYAFQISSGVVFAGNVLYVGGSSMLPLNSVLRAIDTGNNIGDGGIGTASATGVLGNGGSNADAIGVFNVAAGSITSSTVPVDAVFFGQGVGQAVVSGGTAGYALPVNDHYSGGKLQSNSFLAPEVVTGSYIKAEGAYNIQTNTFSTARTWSLTSTFTDESSSITIDALYNFSWSNGATTQDITGLPAGNYCYTVSDISTSVSNCVNVYEPDELSYQLYYLKNVSCYGANDGEVGEYASGGTPPYTYACSAGSLNNLAPGFYEITVTDSKNCVSNPYPFAITEPDEIAVNMTFIDALCYGSSDGGATVLLFGGTAPYAFNWSTGATTSSLLGVPAGNYDLSVTDANNCSVQSTAFVSEPDSITFDLFILNVSCYGLNDGLASVQNVAGGNGGYVYLYNSSSGSSIGVTDGQGNAAEITPGTHTAIVQDAFGCYAEQSFAITQPDSISYTSTITDATSATSADGSISLQITGGTSPYDVLWSNSAMGELITDLLPGNYCATITDDFGCRTNACFDVGFTVGIENTNANAVSIFTANNEIMLFGSINESKKIAVEIYSLTGQLMVRHKTDVESELKFTTNTSGWVSGIYLVRVQSEGLNILKRVLVQ